METEETALWSEKPDWWQCPGCKRKKDECEVVSKKGRTLRKRVEHHDHMRDYAKVFLEQRYGSYAAASDRAGYSPEFAHFFDRVKAFSVRFGFTAVCFDCNEVEGKIKRSIGADKYFSFAAEEIGRGFKKTSNERHVFLEENMDFFREFYRSVKPRLVDERKRQIEFMLEGAVERSILWGGGVKLESIFSEDFLVRKCPPFTSMAELARARANGEPVRYFEAWTRLEIEELLEMWEMGLSHLQIAENLGRTPGAIKFKLEAVRGEGDAL